MLLLAAACAEGPLALDDPERLAAEHAVWTEVLDTLILQRVNRIVVVVDTAPAFNVELFAAAVAARWPTLSPETVADFRTINALPQPINVQLLSTSGPVISVSLAELRDLGLGRNAAQFWNAFYDRFPAAVGLVWLSRVGFKNDRRQAAVLFRYECSATCGSLTAALLGKSGATWSVAATLQYVSGN